LREEAKTTMIIMDSKRVKNTETAGSKGYDAGKTSGIKVHIGLYPQGFASCGLGKDRRGD
jgi:hypothetical protein